MKRTVHEGLAHGEFNAAELHVALDALVARALALVRVVPLDVELRAIESRASTLINTTSFPSCVFA